MGRVARLAGFGSLRLFVVADRWSSWGWGQHRFSSAEHRAEQARRSWAAGVLGASGACRRAKATNAPHPPFLRRKDSDDPELRNRR